jgi:hypothetical protein
MQWALFMVGPMFTLTGFAFAVASNTQGKMALAINAGISFNGGI